MGFCLHQFSEIFEIRDAAKRPYILIGGQAVNYWAEEYLAQEPLLKSLQPYTSQDIDFKGGREDVERIARQLGLIPVYPPKVEMTALAGLIPLHIGGRASAIEVVRRIPGISDRDDPPVIEAEYDGKAIRVLHPISLLACKLVLAATVSQQDRQDVAHLRMLVPCVRAFLADLLEEVELGELSPRDWLKVVNQALKLTHTSRARKIEKAHNIHWLDILPLDAIREEPEPETQAVPGTATGTGLQKIEGHLHLMPGRRFDWPACPRASTTGQTNRLSNGNLCVRALNGHFEIPLHCAVVRSSHSRPAPFRLPISKRPLSAPRSNPIPTFSRTESLAAFWNAKAVHCC